MIGLCRTRIQKPEPATTQSLASLFQSSRRTGFRVQSLSHQHAHQAGFDVVDLCCGLPVTSSASSVGIRARAIVSRSTRPSSAPCSRAEDSRGSFAYAGTASCRGHVPPVDAVVFAPLSLGNTRTMLSATWRACGRRGLRLTRLSSRRVPGRHPAVHKLGSARGPLAPGAAHRGAKSKATDALWTAEIPPPSARARIHRGTVDSAAKLMYRRLGRHLRVCSHLWALPARSKPHRRGRSACAMPWMN